MHRPSQSGTGLYRAEVVPSTEYMEKTTPELATHLNIKVAKEYGEAHPKSKFI